MICSHISYDKIFSMIKIFVFLLFGALSLVSSASIGFEPVDEHCQVASSMDSNMSMSQHQECAQCALGYFIVLDFSIYKSASIDQYLPKLTLTSFYLSKVFKVVNPPPISA